MPAWNPILVLPNIDIHHAVIGIKGAIVGREDQRVQAIEEEHPIFGDFLNRFAGQFNEPVQPSVLLIKASAGSSYVTAQSVGGFRDLVTASTVPLARARRLIHLRPQPLAYSNPFAFYPWMIDKNYDDLTIFTAAQMGIHQVSEFRGQPGPEQPPTTLMQSDIDGPLMDALIKRWLVRFSKKGGTWGDRALFRSLNMANEAARIPVSTATTFYDFGRSLSLWVSAFEILTHPGAKQKASIFTVFDVLEKVKWLDKKLSQATHPTGPKAVPRILASHVYERIYSLRNDFLHGNDVSADKLVVGAKNRLMIDYAACLYRLALSGALDLFFPEKPIPSLDEPKKFAKHLADCMAFEDPQREHEKALRTFL